MKDIGIHNKDREAHLVRVCGPGEVQGSRDHTAQEEGAVCTAIRGMVWIHPLQGGVFSKRGAS